MDPVRDDCQGFRILALGYCRPGLMMCICIYHILLMRMKAANTESTSFLKKNSVPHPVRTAIYAAYILRTMHRRCQDIAQSDRAKMIANADHFENLAVRVYKAAAADDLELAKNCLDCGLEMWTGDHLIDLVVKSGSHDFLEECCTEVLNFRLYGDLDPRTSETKIGLCKLTLGILTLGFLPALFPKFLKWVPPPRCVIHVYIDAYLLREGECVICMCLCQCISLSPKHTRLRYHCLSPGGRPCVEKCNAGQRLLDGPTIPAETLFSENFKNQQIFGDRGTDFSRGSRVMTLLNFEN